MGKLQEFTQKKKLKSSAILVECPFLTIIPVMFCQGTQGSGPGFGSRTSWSCANLEIDHLLPWLSHRWMDGLIDG